MTARARVKGAGQMPIDWLVLSAALLSGLMGGLHCAAMCGGIATGFSALSPSAAPWASALQANLGRIGGYTLAGAVVGGFGHGLLSVLRLPWLGFTLRLLVGLALIVLALRMFGRGRWFNQLPGPGMQLWAWLRPLQSRLVPANTIPRRLLLGVLWGWLPCGLSLSLIGVAWLQASARNGALTMLAFGLGTLPVMLPLTWSGQRISGVLQRPLLRHFAAALVLGMGLMTIAAPWLMQLPALHGALSALGCVPLSRSVP